MAVRVQVPLRVLGRIIAVVAQLVERRLPKPKVTSSNLAYRSFYVVLDIFQDHFFLYQ